MSLCSQKLAEVAEQIVTNPIISEHEFKAEANKKIDVALAELEKKLRSTNDRFLRKALQEVTVGGLAICATVASGLPWPLLLLLSSLKNVIDQLGDLLDAKRQIREENGLSLLLSLRNRV